MRPARISKYQIFDITSRSTDPSKITLVSEITGTPPSSCGPGCGGLFTHRAHKGWWSQDTGYFYAASGEPGFRNVIIQIFDLKDPKAPKFVGRAWLPSQKEGEPGYENQYAHHPVVDEERKRLYVGYRNSGWTAEFDIADPARPKLVWSLDMNPPHRGPHTVSPIVYDTVPNFGKEALPRRYAFVVDEAGGTADMAPCPGGVRTGSYMLDITNETKPFPVSVWQVPVGNFCTKGGRFGPHQSADTVNGRLNRFENKIAWLAYFNAGIRVLDLSDPYQMKELGYYIPKTNERSHPIAMGQPTVIQINDVDIDSRGLAYASDRVGYWLVYPGVRQTDTVTRRSLFEVTTRVDAPRVLSPGLPTRGHPIAQSPRDGDPGVLGAKSTCDEMAPPPQHAGVRVGDPGPARRAGRPHPAPHPAPPAPRNLVNSVVRVHVCWLAAACARPTSTRSRNAGGAIPRVDFRHRVLVAAS